MKYILFLAFLVLVASCSNEIQLEPRMAYFLKWDNGFHSIDDTLILSASAGTKDVCRIDRHTSYIKRLDGRSFPREWKNETWVADWNAGKRTLISENKGRILVMEDDRKVLVWGNRRYARIK